MKTRKYAWLIAMLAVLSFAFIGCSGGTFNIDDIFYSQEVETVVYDMSENAAIQALSGVIAFPEGGANPIAPLNRAGGDEHITITAVEEEDGISLLLEVSSAGSWGAGIDLNFSAMGFKVGDIVTVTGEVIEFASGGKLQFNSTPGSENAIGNVISAKGDFTMTVTLTGAHIGQIQGANPAALRIEAGRTGGGNKVRIDNINVTGMRATKMVDLATPVITKTETGIAWTAIEGASGYRVFNGDDVLGSAGSTATSYVMNHNPGTYNVSIIALGVANVSNNSARSNVIEFEVDERPEIDFKIAGKAAKAEIRIVNGKVDLVDNGYKAEFTGQYGSSYAQFFVDFGKDEEGEPIKLSDFSKVTLDYKGVDGDFNYKPVIIAASKDLVTGNPGNFSNLTLGTTESGNAESTRSLEIFFTSDLYETLGDESELWFLVHIHAEPATFEVTNIEFVKPAFVKESEFGITVLSSSNGNFDTADVLVIKLAPSGSTPRESMLRILMTNGAGADRSGWGVGQIAATLGGSPAISFNGLKDTTGYIDIPIGKIQELGILGNLNINIYNDHAVTGAELWLWK